MGIPVGMTRAIPSINNSLLFFLGGKRGEINEETYVAEYEKAMDKREQNIEKWLLDTFAHLGIRASVKRDRYSLPIMYQIKATQYGESYLNGAFETYNIFRKVLGTLLTDDIHKIRFYVFAEVLIQIMFV